jgi:alkane 1-monooxygenase
VSTPEDPASAKYNELLYAFWLRSIFLGYRSAWKIQLKELKRKNAKFFGRENEMFFYILIQLSLLLLIAVFFSWKIMLYYFMAAIIGILLLETVNYIEHYALLRMKREDGTYIAVKPIHSWNSDHRLGRGMLFELSRHSDHHYKASRKYQILRSFKDSPQMPTGYPGMIVLSLFSPLWFLVMNKKVKLLRSQYPELLA